MDDNKKCHIISKYDLSGATIKLIIIILYSVLTTKLQSHECSGFELYL